jgi:uncharacterized membrane protein (DUF4010 family)
VSPWPLFRELALALTLAFFFGIAFEDYYTRVKESRPGGVRTFPMLALVGALLYMLDPARLLPLTAGILAIGGWLAIYYLRRTEERGEEGQIAFGLMVPVCNIAAFLLGPTAIAAPSWVASGVTAAAVFFLTGRDQLHRFAREIEIPELVTAGKFLVISGLVLPLLPDHPITDLTPVTPRQAWLAVIAVSGISYTSYLLQRYARPKGANFLVAVLGGLYSSTATTIALARLAKEDESRAHDIRSGILIATALMYVRIFVMAAIFNGALARLLLIPCLSLGFAAIATAWVISKFRSSNMAQHAAAVPTINPLAISTAAAFATFFVLISLATTFAQETFGIRGLYSLAAMVGFTDIDPFVLNLSAGGPAFVATHVAGVAILIAASANNLFKAACARVIAGRALGAAPIVGLVFLAGLGLAGAGGLP